MTETEEEIIDVGMESSKESDHLVPSSPAPSSSLTHSPLGGNPLVLSPQSPFQAYSARLRSEADYERYKACKESQAHAQAFYKLATLTAIQTYYQNQLTSSLNGGNNSTLSPTTSSPLSPLFLQQQLLARAAVAVASSSNNNPNLNSPPNSNFPASLESKCHPVVPGGGVGVTDLTLKSIGLGSPPLKPFGMNKRPSPPDDSPKSHRGSPTKKTKISPPRRKASRKLAFDEDKTSPVSGTIIRELAEGEEVPAIHKGDIPPEFNVVEVTEEAKAELAKIENKIGDYCCCLCKEVYSDAFGLAQHRCSMIVHVEYRCPECDKVFNCPANLASHRRWHKPKQQPQQHNINSNGTVTDSSGSSSTEENNNKTDDHPPSSQHQFTCDFCSKFFKRSQSLRKHLIQSHPEEYLSHQNNDNSNNNNKLEEDSESMTNHNSPGREIQNSPANSSSPMSSPNSSTTKYSIAELLSNNKEPKPKQLIHQPIATLFQCKICAETLPNMAELSQHITLQHLSKGHSNITASAVGLLQPLLQSQPSFLFNHHH